MVRKLEGGAFRDNHGPQGRRDESPASAVDLIALYLEEVGSMPLIDQEREIELGRALSEARKGLAGVARKLPTSCGSFVLDPDQGASRPAANWPLADIEEFYCRLIGYYREHQADTHLTAAVHRARRLKKRLDNARDAFVLANLRLVVHIAKKYPNTGLSFMDLVQEGNIGLMKAVEKFEYERANKFSTYAYWWIKQAIERAITDKARVIRIPVHVNEKTKKIARVSRELGEMLGRKPTPQEIAKKLRMPVSKVEEILGVVQDPQALEDFAADEDSPGLLRFVADPNAPDPLERARERELREKIAQTLKLLNPREEKVIRLRFGIGRDRPYTLQAIGDMMYLSRERVRQIEAIALRKILAAQQNQELRELVS